jgi:hypothetical protein
MRDAHADEGLAPLGKQRNGGNMKFQLIGGIVGLVVALGVGQLVAPIDLWVSAVLGAGFTLVGLIVGLGFDRRSCL